jgi:hypothetical protein
MGLLRTAARTAVITGTATRVASRTAARQQAYVAERTAPAAPPPPPPAAPPPQPPVAAAPPVSVQSTDPSAMLEQLKQLAELKAAGVLTEAEFQVQKERILSGG